MKRIILTALLAAGCGPLVTEPMPDIPETVEYDTVRIEYGDDDLVEPGEAEQALEPSPAALVGDPSLIALLTGTTVAGTNLTIWFQLKLIEEVTRHRPTSWDEGVWTWDNAEFKKEDEQYGVFEIREIEPGRYSYSWRVGNTMDERLEVFSGEFSPRDRVDGQQRGTGIIRFDFDNIRAVDPDGKGPEAGRVAIAFRSIGGVRQVRVATFDLVEDGKTEARSALYRYTQLPTGRGRFQWATPADFLEDGEPLELLSIDSAWTPEKAGRAQARVTGGSLEINEVLLHECWGADGKYVFGDLTPDMPAVPYEDGTVDACAGNLNDIELDPPTYQRPETEPEIPGPHPDEQ
jgi:hypothetical protein